MTHGANFSKKTVRRASGHGVFRLVSFFNPLRPLLRRSPLVPRNGEGALALRADYSTPAKLACCADFKMKRDGRRASPRSSRDSLPSQSILSFILTEVQPFINYFIEGGVNGLKKESIGREFAGLRFVASLRFRQNGSAISSQGKSTSVFSWEIGAMGNGTVKRYAHEQGAALLATTLAVIIILLAMGLSMTSSGLFESFMSHAQSDSRGAFAAAQSGIKDAHLRTARNKNFSSAAYYIPTGCTMNGGTLCTKVIVEKDTASSCSQTISAGQDCLIAAGTLNNTTRTIEVILDVNATNGKITQASWKEI